MRKSSPFVAVPTVPMTISGQWLTFSHMANHYRKILNVKPRVDTAAPKLSSMEVSSKPSSKLRNITRRPIYTAPPERNVPKAKKKIPQSAKPNTPMSDRRELQLRNLNKAYNSPISPRMPTNSKRASYQVVFGPSKLKLSQEDLTAESEFEESIGGVSAMGIAEKIQLFLGQMQDNQPNGGRGLLNGKREPIRSRDDINESYLARHSKCFIPIFETEKVRNQITNSNNARSNRGSPQLTSKPSKVKSKSKQPFISDHSFTANKQILHKLSNTTPKVLPKPKPTNGASTFPTANDILQAEIRKIKKLESKKKVQQRSRSPGSISAGTIHGTDELTEARLLPQTANRHSKSPVSAHRRSVNRDREHAIRIADEEEISTGWLKEKVDKGLIRINNAYFQLGNSNAPSTTSAPAFLLPNKDSSRDSAYGFSSGESRITTRESTPEKIGKSCKIKKNSPDIGKYKSSLSTVASSTNDSPARSTNFHQKLSDTKEIPNSKLVCGSRTSWASDSRYIDFLTAVTDDVVSRGIYTNKGLKTLFQAHIDRNKGLELDKMNHMLNRLRMDVGVPMDDSLNQLEFGYGSIKYSTPPFFYKSTSSTTESKEKIYNRPSTFEKDSDVSVLELHQKHSLDYHSTDEANSKPSSSCNTSVINGESNRRCNSPKPASSQNSEDSSISLTESEITNALKEVGFDSETTLDIVKIVSKRTKPSQRKVGLSQDRLNSTFVTSKPGSFKSSRSQSNSRGSTGSY